MLRGHSIYGTVVRLAYVISSTIGHNKFLGPRSSHRQNHIRLVVEVCDLNHPVSKIRQTRRCQIDPNGTHIILVPNAQVFHTLSRIDKVCNRLSCILCREIEMLYHSVVCVFDIRCSSPVVEQSCRLVCAQIIYFFDIDSLYGACI